MDDRPTHAGHPNPLILQPAIQFTAALVLEVEGVEGTEE